VTGRLALPGLAEYQHFRAGNAPGFVLTLGKKGEEQERERERKVCAVPDLTQQINISLLNYWKGGWLPRTGTLRRKEQLRDRARLSCCVLSEAVGIQMVGPRYRCEADIHGVRVWGGRAT